MPEEYHAKYIKDICDNVWIIDRALTYGKFRDLPNDKLKEIANTLDKIIATLS